MPQEQIGMNLKTGEGLPSLGETWRGMMEEVTRQFKEQGMSLHQQIIDPPKRGTPEYEDMQKRYLDDILSFSTGTMRIPGRKIKGYADDIMQMFSPVKGIYREPFLGSGTLLRQLFHKGFIKGRAVVSESNARVRNVHTQLQRNSGDVLEQTMKYKNLHDIGSQDGRIKFLRELEENYQWLTKAEQAAADIVIGQHTRLHIPGVKTIQAPGKYIKAEGLKTRLEEMSKALRETQANIFSDFHQSLRGAKRGDFLLLDPPYHGVSGYGKSFSTKELNRLYQSFKKSTSGVLYESDKAIPYYPGADFVPTGKPLAGGLEVKHIWKN